MAVVGNLGPDLRTLDAAMTSTATITAKDGRSGLARRKTLVERSSEEEPVTSGMREGSRGATWGASNGRDVHPTVRRCYTRFQGRDEPGRTREARYRLGTKYPEIRPAMNLPQPSDSSAIPSISQT